MIIHEDSAYGANLAKQVGQSSEKRGSPRAEKDGARCDAKFSSGVEYTHCDFEKDPKKVIWHCIYSVSLIFNCRLLNNPG